MHLRKISLHDRFFKPRPWHVVCKSSNSQFQMANHRDWGIMGYNDVIVGVMVINMTNTFFFTALDQSIGFLIMNVQNNLSSNHFSVEDATELALDRPLWGLLAASGAMQWNGASWTMMTASHLYPEHPHRTSQNSSYSHGTLGCTLTSYVKHGDGPP